MMAYQLSSRSPGEETIVEAVGLTKIYGGVRALANVDLRVRAGTVHGLVGSNGAGKSTLVGVLSGTVVPDQGRVTLDGRALSLGDPRKCQQLGLATVFQHSALISSLSVAENVALGRTPTKHGFANSRVEMERARVAMRLADLDTDPRAIAETLSLGDRRLLEIARALSQDARCILLDEPTSALTRAESERLVAQIREARDRGVAFIYVSHFLADVLDICDEVTVLRDGKTVGSVLPSETNVSDLVRLMLGDRPEVAKRRTERSTGEPLLVADHLSVGEVLVDAGFTLYRNEILGLTGLRGSGVDQLARALGGVVQHGGELMLDGRTLRLRSPHEALAHGVAYLPGDRLEEGVLIDAPVLDNAVLSTYASFSTRLGFLSHRRMGRAVRDELDRFGVVRRDEDMPLGQLSGGNQQKVVLARLAQTNPRVLVLHGPTIGIDVGAKRQIAEWINGVATEDRGILLVSDDMEELCELCDRVLVVSRGRIARELVRDELEPETLHVACQTGGKEAASI